MRPTRPTSASPSHRQPEASFTACANYDHNHPRKHPLMKNLSLCLLTLALLLRVQLGLSQTTAFTYQGRLNDGGNPANGSYDLQFSLYDGGESPISTIIRSKTAVT